MKDNEIKLLSAMFNRVETCYEEIVEYSIENSIVALTLMTVAKELMDSKLLSEAAGTTLLTHMFEKYLATSAVLSEEEKFWEKIAHDMKKEEEDS